MIDMSWEMLLDVYMFMAVGYNALSLVVKDVKGRGLAPTDPAFGILMMTSVYLWFRLASALATPLYPFFAVVFVLLIARFGIYQHVVSYANGGYFNRVSWGAAIAINLFGVIILAGNVYIST